MTDTSTSKNLTGAVPGTGDGDPTPVLPWPSLLVLGGTAFVMVTAEMLPTAVLPDSRSARRWPSPAASTSAAGLGSSPPKSRAGARELRATR